MWCERIEARGPLQRRATGGGTVVAFVRRGSDADAARAIGLVAEAHGVPLHMLLQRERGGARVAEARQLAMYLMHVVERRLYADIGRVFGRDRTTVSHACAVVEERRENTAYDESVGRLEQTLNGEAP